MTLNKQKYKGVEKNLPNINIDEVDMIYVTKTDTLAFQESSPMFLFAYQNNIYIGICHLFKLSLFSDFEDLDNNFSELCPGELEFLILEELDPTYYLFDYDKTMQGDLDEFSDYELDLIKNWNRELTLNKLLSK